MHHKFIKRRQFLLAATGSIVAAIGAAKKINASVDNPILSSITDKVDAPPGALIDQPLFRQQVRSVPHIELLGWTLHVGGMVQNRLRLSYPDFVILPSFELDSTLACIGSSPQTPLIGQALWRGVLLQTLAERAVIHADAKFVQFFTADGYVTSLPLEQMSSLMVAYEMDGETLKPEHGYPARVIAPGLYGYKMPKWLTSIQFATEPISGFWEGRGWSETGEVQTASYIFSPQHLQAVSGHVQFSGIAFAGARKIIQVEVSIDDAPWMPAVINPAEPFRWTMWQVDWQPPAPGDYLVKVRASDDSGFVQTDHAGQSAFPNGSAAVHTIIVRVSRV